MRLEKPISAKALASEIGAELVGNEDLMITGINEIHKVQAGDLTFVDIDKYYQKSLHSAASVILIDKKVACPEGKALLITDKPFFIYDQLVRKYRPFQPLFESISTSAHIDPSAIIEPQVVIGHHVTIGAGTYIQAHCYIGSYTKIGERVIIQAGTMIGTDAFYFKSHGHQYEKWHSGGDVQIDNDVFIGAACTINKGVSGTTHIGRGCKLDSQVHLGHGVVLGEHCLLAGQVGIGGKTVLGRNVKVYGQAGIANNLTIGDDAVILAKSAVLKNLEGGKSYFGVPAEESRQKFMQLVAMRNLIK